MRKSIVLTAFLAFPVYTLAQSDRKATVVTKEGETIEGTFVGATNESVSIVIAGQTLEIPGDTVRYISFTGKIEAQAPVAANDGLSAALAAIKELQTSTEIGLLRDQYSARLLETMPALTDYIKSGRKEWLDCQLALAQALQDYQNALKEWGNAKLYWASARAWTEYVEHLREVSTPEHVESPEKLEVPLRGGTFEGRLGAGDTLMPVELDKSAAGAFNDVYVLDVPGPGEIKILLEWRRGLGILHTTIVDPDGKKLEADRSRGKVETRKKVDKAGQYEFWIGGGYPNAPAEYYVAIGFEPK